MSIFESMSKIFSKKEKLNPEDMAKKVARLEKKNKAIAEKNPAAIYEIEDEIKNEIKEIQSKISSGGYHKRGHVHGPWGLMEKRDGKFQELEKITGFPKEKYKELFEMQEKIKDELWDGGFKRGQGFAAEKELTPEIKKWKELDDERRETIDSLAAPEK